MKKYVYCTTAKLSSKKQKNSSFTKEKSLVGLSPVYGREIIVKIVESRIKICVTSFMDDPLPSNVDLR